MLKNTQSGNVIVKYSVVNANGETRHKPDLTHIGQTEDYQKGQGRWLWPVDRTFEICAKI